MRVDSDAAWEEPVNQFIQLNQGLTHMYLCYDLHPTNEHPCRLESASTATEFEFTLTWASW